MSKKRLNKLKNKILNDNELTNEEKIMLFILNDNMYFISRLISFIENGNAKGKI